MIFIQVVCGRPDGRLQFSGGGSKMAWPASAFSSIRARCPKKVRRRDLVMDGNATDVGISDKIVSRILRRHRWSTASIRYMSAFALLMLKHCLVFPVAAARAWIDLPPTITASPSLLTFRQQLTTFLFHTRFY